MTRKEKKFLYLPVMSIPAQFMKQLRESRNPGTPATVLTRVFCPQVCFPIIRSSTGFL